MADVLAFWDDRKLMEYSRFIQERKKSAVLIKYCICATRHNIYTEGGTLEIFSNALITVEVYLLCDNRRKYIEKQ